MVVCYIFCWSSGLSFVSVVYLFRCILYCCLFFFFLILRPPPSSPLFPYPTLFRPRDDTNRALDRRPESIDRIALENGARRPGRRRGTTPASPWRAKRRNRARTVWTSIPSAPYYRSEEHTSELQSQSNLVCRLLLEK